MTKEDLIVVLKTEIEEADDNVLMDIQNKYFHDVLTIGKNVFLKEFVITTLNGLLVPFEEI